MSKTFVTNGIVSFTLLYAVALTACSNPVAFNKPVNIPPATAAAPAVSEIVIGPVNPINPVKSEIPVVPDTTKVLPEEPNTRINATWITPVTIIKENLIVLPASKIEEDTLIHFFVSTSLGKMPFMAYVFEGKTYVRADICVPCKSYDFSLQQDVLICASCGSYFNAETGEGISGACVRYSQAEVSYEKKDGSLLLKWDALKTAYQSTLSPGLDALGGSSSGGQASCH